MIGNKAGTFGLYAAAVLCSTLLLPWMRRQAWFSPLSSSGDASVSSGRWAARLALVLLLVVAVSNAAMVKPSLWMMVCLAAFAYAWSAGSGRMEAWFGFVAGALISLALPWWLQVNGRHWAPLPTWQGLGFVVILAVVARVLTREQPADALPSRPGRSWLAALPALALSLSMLASTGVAWTQPIMTSWHHWGAYVGPAQMVLAGAVPLHDIPLQYGLGPTLLLSVLGHQGAWMAMFVAAGSLTLLMVALLCGLALRLWRPAPLSTRVLLCLIVSWACLAWTAYPASMMSSLATPSTTGMRFAPGVMMLAALAVMQLRHAHGRSAPWLVGHALWLLCAIWSPEAGVQASVVWVPAFFWNRAVRDGRWDTRLAGRAVAQLLVAVLVGLAGFAALFWSIWHEWPLPVEYVAYLLHPPGPLPVSTKGSLRFAVVAFGCWLFAMSRVEPSDTDRGTRQVAWSAGLLALATFTYYLGRSHDNNILNLAPFLALLLIAASRLARVGSILHHLSLVMLASLLAWSVVFGFGNVGQAWRAGKLLSVDAHALTSSFDRQSEHGLGYMAPEAAKLGLVPADAARAIEFIRRERHEVVETFDLFMVVDQGELLPPWNALHGPENFVYIPAQDRQRYLRRVARRLKSAGWVMFERQTNMNEYLADYDSVYRRTEILQFGTYTAIRYAP